MMSWIIPTLMFVATVIFAWAMVCNELTYRDRKRLAGGLFEQPNWERLLASYRIVSYEEHYYARMSFRSPRDLYAADLRPFFERTAT